MTSPANVRLEVWLRTVEHEVVRQLADSGVCFWRAPAYVRRGSVARLIFFSLREATSRSGCLFSGSGEPFPWVLPSVAMAHEGIEQLSSLVEALAVQVKALDSRVATLQGESSQRAGAPAPTLPFHQPHSQQTGVDAEIEDASEAGDSLSRIQAIFKKLTGTSVPEVPVESCFFESDGSNIAHCGHNPVTRPAGSKFGQWFDVLKSADGLKIGNSLGIKSGFFAEYANWAPFLAHTFDWFVHLVRLIAHPDLATESRVVLTDAVAAWSVGIAPVGLRSPRVLTTSPSRVTT